MDLVADIVETLAEYSKPASLQTAIQLKDAIDIAPKKLSPIGIVKCVSEIYHEDSSESEIEDSDNEETEIIDSLRKEIKRPFYSTFKVDPFWINITGNQEMIPFNANRLRQLYSEGADSPFGDNTSMKTVVDKEVRDAREITKFTVDPKILGLIKEKWQSSLYPKKGVSVVPYKINLYNSTGHFDEHRDTPEKNLIGTAIISLWSQCFTNALKVFDTNKEESYTWHPRNPQCILFYSDCPHSVGKSSYGNIRGTLTFKIYAEEIDEPEQETVVADILSKLISRNSEPKGFILSYGYSIERSTLKGSDQILINALKELRRKYIIIPVMYEYSHSKSEDNSYKEINTRVYSLTENNINYLLNCSPDIKGSEVKAKVNPDSFRNYTFYALNYNFKIWSQTFSEYIEYTGNESKPEMKNSIYISHAVLLR